MERWIYGVVIILLSACVGILYGKVKSLERIVCGLIGLAKALKVQHDACDEYVKQSRQIVDSVENLHNLVMNKCDLVSQQYEAIDRKIKRIDSVAGINK